MSKLAMPKIDRKLLSKKATVIGNLKKIISVVHPLVKKEMNFFLKKNSKRKIVVLDIPLLIENKLNKKNDILIFIDAKKKKIN